MRLYPAVLVVVLLIAVACGSRHTENGSTFLQQQLVELDRLPQPSGVDPTKWSELKSTLRAMIEERIASGHTASSTADGNLSKAPLTFDPGTGALSWGYYNVGDYDQNGEVNVADLSPLGKYQLQSVSGPGSNLAAVDGDSNGEINVADLTPLGANLGNHVANYQIYSSQVAADYPASNKTPSTIAALDHVDFAAATGNKTQQRLQFNFTIPSPQAGDIYWVRPSDGEIEGTPSTQANGRGGGPSEPGIELYQVSYDYGDGETYPNTTWGEVALTFMGVAEVQYFNLTVNGTPVLTNIPIVSDQGLDTLQTVNLPFDLGNVDGEEVTTAEADYTLETTPKAASAARHTSGTLTLPVHNLLKGPIPDPQLESPPGHAVNDFGRDPAQDGNVQSTSIQDSAFPNQECGKNETTPAAVSNSLMYLKQHLGVQIGAEFGRPIDIASVREMLGEVFEGGNFKGVSFSWAENKRSYMKDNSWPVETISTGNLREAAAAMDAGWDVEISHSNGVRTWVHAIKSISISDTGNAVFQLLSDNAPGKPGGLGEFDVCSKIGASPGGAYASAPVPRGEGYFSFVIERPQQPPAWTASNIYDDTASGEQVSTVTKADGSIGFSYLHSFGEQQAYYGELSLPFLLPSTTVNIDPQPTRTLGHHNSLSLLQDDRMASVFQDDSNGLHQICCCTSTDETGQAWNPEQILISDPTAFPGDNIDCEVASDGKLDVICSERGGNLSYCQSTSAACDAFTPVAEVPSSYSLHCECVQNLAGEICVAYEGSGEIKVLNNFDCSDGSSDPPLTIATGVDDGVVECFDFIYDAAAGMYYMTFMDAVTGLNLIQSSDAVTWSVPIDLDILANDGRGMSLTTMDDNLAVAYYGSGTGAVPIYYLEFDPADPLASTPEILGTAYSSFGHQDALTIENAFSTSNKCGYGIVFAPDPSSTIMTLYSLPRL